MHSCGAIRKHCFRLLLFSLVANFTWAQSETATVSGQVVDPSGLNITGAQVKLVDIDRETSTSTTTNNIGLYTFPSVRPGRYRIAVTAPGFKVVNVTGVTVNVQDHLEQNFKLVVGSVSESITVEGGAPFVDTQSATVSTVVDRNFAENLPLNGRSFQTLIDLTPGVVLTPSTSTDPGQFSVNGQRASSNYWIVDGVSANVGMTTSFGQLGNQAAGAAAGLSVQGGTNSLVSVDALQEFRIVTSTYAPEFGRTPGGQISIVTRSGTNQFHGTVFDYFRNDVLDASNWFNGYINSPPLSKAQERQNDFGGTVGGPIWKNHTFFFFSYEGLRLRLPQVVDTSVPSLAARENAIPATQQLLDAFPVPAPGAADVDGTSPFNASYSNQSTLNATSLRADDRFNDKLLLFARYNYAPSKLLLRGQQGEPLSSITPEQMATQTGTVGATMTLSASTVNDARFNYSTTAANSSTNQDTFGGAITPSLTGLFPNPFTTSNGVFSFTILSIADGSLYYGPIANNRQEQFNLVDTVSWQHRNHSLKFGVDYRRLLPHFDGAQYAQFVDFLDVPSAEAGNFYLASTRSLSSATLAFQNLGVFAQDTWKLHSRVTVTYGIRWDVDFTPTSVSGPALAAVTGFSSPATLAIAPAGTPVFTTRFGNVAPRGGLAYQIRQNPDFGMVVRGGFGIFYDLATQELGGAFSGTFPFEGYNSFIGGTFPLSPQMSAPPGISSAQAVILAANPNLTLPYTLQWNAAVEQQLGTDRTISASYVGAAGRRLIQSEIIQAPNENISFADLVTNAGSSDYDALQLQFIQRLSRGFQATASYSWAHSIDTGSASSAGSVSNFYSPVLGANANRGPSDFDVRNAFSLALTYDVRALKQGGLFGALLRGWSVQNVVQARSAAPVDVDDSILSYSFSAGEYSTGVRPDVVPGKPLYLYGGQFPGGKGFNPAAFTLPPIDPTTGAPLRQGDLGRNALRGFRAAQWDCAIHRDFPIRDSLKLQFRAEGFNLLNHPNFGNPVGDLSNPLFGLSTQMLAGSLDQNTGGGGFSALYQMGGPRSLQLALKLQF